MIESFAENQKVYFGESIPQMITENVDKILEGTIDKPKGGDASTGGDVKSSANGFTLETLRAGDGKNIP